MANTAKVSWVDGALFVAEAGSGHDQVQPRQ